MWNSRSNSFTTKICPHTQIQQRHVIGAGCITRLHTRSENYTVCFMQVSLQPPQCSCHMVLATHIHNTENWACVRTYICTDCIPNLWMYAYLHINPCWLPTSHPHSFIHLFYSHSPPCSHPLTPPQSHPLTPPSHTHSPPLSPSTVWPSLLPDQGQHHSCLSSPRSRTWTCGSWSRWRAVHCSYMEGRTFEAGRSWHTGKEALQTEKGKGEL